MPQSKSTIALFVFFVSVTTILFLVWHSGPDVTAIWSHEEPKLHVADKTPSPKEENTRLHFLLPASNRDINLCKTLLTTTVLDYPVPTLTAWEETYDTGYLLGGGSHVAKISKVLEYLNTIPTTEDDDLVLIADAYDIWFQLPKDVLVSRYRDMITFGNDQIHTRLGSSASKQGISAQIVFAAGKRCAPNQPHTIACYPLPDSPIDDNIYGGNTDTIMGWNKYSSNKQRYLNSGYIIGPIGHVKKMFVKAWAMAESIPEHDPNDNGSGGSDFLYHGSDQSIFNILFGIQEYRRASLEAKAFSLRGKKSTSKAKPNTIEGTVISDRLNPSFTHEKLGREPAPDDELGIMLDYFSELGHQTVNSESDARFIVYANDVKEQVSHDRGMFDCASRLAALHTDIASAEMPLASINASFPDAAVPGWKDVPLYAHLCLDQIPVMIHHNGDKSARERSWQSLWLQRYGRELLEVKSRALPHTVAVAGGGGDDSHDGMMTQKAIIARTDKGQSLEWKDLCSAEMDREIFGHP
ncbi:hypothetical protein MBLNU457_1990t1 [Dothideomycetes sp. NU457]